MNKNQLTQILTIILFSFIILMAIRLTLYNFYPDDFSDLTSNELFFSFLMALRVDMIIIFTFSSIFILTLLFIKNQKARSTIAVLWSIILNIIFILSFSNVLYFDFTHKHMSSEIFNLGNDMDIIIDMAFGSMSQYTFGAIIFSLLFSYITYRIFSIKPKYFISGKAIIIPTIIISIVLFLGIRNKLSGKSFGISDAYAVNKVSSGNLALNGFFTAYKASKKTTKHNLVKYNEAIEITQEVLKTKNAPFMNKDYPLMRQYSKKNKPQYNIVIILLESFGAEHLDGFTRYKELNVTPYFKKLSNSGLKFTNFYSNGYRSIFGITSIFTGVTIPSGVDYLGKGLELSNLNYLGNVAKKNGYSTISMQAGNRRSYRIDAVSTLAGFDDYYGAQDMPNIEDVDEGRTSKTGTYDFNMLNFYHKKLNKMKEPFLGFAFTASTHSDYHLPSKKFERYPHTLKGYNGRLNSLIYADNSISRFMENIKSEPWFDNTIFIFTSDHGSGNALSSTAKKYRPNDKALASIEHFRIPLIIYAPKIFKHKEINRLGSHNDIFPTIVDMLGWESNITTMGNSLFDKEIKKRFVYFYAGSLIGLITDNGYIKYNFNTIVEKVGQDEDIKKMKHLLFSIDTAEAQLLKRNKWSK